jgi:Ca-activated chloride channel family protein
VGAVAARRPEELGAPRWPLVMQRLEARVRIVGDLAITEMEQTFFNPAADTVEGIYRFHVPRGAVLQRFAVDRHGTLVDGTVQERQRAAAAYQAQVYAGSTLDPALLEWDAPGRYHARLYPIAPGQTRRLLVTYSQWLRTRDDGGRSWRLPLAALGARIGELYVNVDLERAGARDVRAGLGAVRDEQHVVLTRSDITPHADFVVDLRTDTPRPGSLARLEAPPGDDPDRSAFLRVAVRAPMPPGADAAEGAMDLVLLVDHSAATPPASLRLQQDLAEALTRALGPEDRLLMLAGDVRTRPLGAHTLTGVTQATRAEALDALAADNP